MHQWMVQGFDGVGIKIIIGMKEDEQTKVTDEMIRESERIWDDPKKILALIDLLFLWEDPDRRQVCS